MLTLGQVAKASGGTLTRGNPDRVISGVSSDSRTIRAEELFIALAGERFDGHDFLDQAFQKNAAGAVVGRKPGREYPCVLVGDTLNALHRLARFYRAQFQVPVVAVTGSAGKTTTKECIAVLLSDVFRVRVGFGNWNNHIGVPLNLFRLSPDDQCFVLELGANHLREIELLAGIAGPTVGVFTGIYPVHLEGFGSLERIYEAKLELADYLDRTGGAVIANGDDPQLIQRLRKRRATLITFGHEPASDYVISDLSASGGSIYFRVNDRLEFRLRGYGAFNAMNALAAIAVAGYFKLDLKRLSESWRRLPAIKGRFQLERYDSHDLEIIDDSYNANPESFERAIESFHQLAGRRRKIAVVGDMLELGEDARHYHEALGRTLAEREIRLVIGIGSLSRSTLEAFMKTNPSGEAHHFESVPAASEFLASAFREGDSVLIKGSHGMHLGQVKPYLDDYFRKEKLVRPVRVKSGSDDGSANGVRLG